MQKSNINKHVPYIIPMVILAMLLLRQSFQYHKANDHVIWKKEYHADAGGYYGHLLMWFKYGYKSSDFPPQTDSLFGKGFHLDTYIVRDKYTCGVAYLLAPFYAGQQFFEAITSKNKTPDTISARRSVDIAAIFYLLAGCLCLFYFIIQYTKPIYALLSILLIVAGTNIFFYAIYHPGMSHIYSFFLFSAYLYVGSMFYYKKKTIHLALLAAIASCIILIRPTDIFFLPVLFFLGRNPIAIVQSMLKPLHVLIIILIPILIFFPQCYYWYLFSGRIIYYSYGNEGFSHLWNPQFLRVLFAPYNGLIPYSLIFMILVVINFILVFKGKRYAIYFLLYQIITLYLISSWWAPSFGDGYGQRNYVQSFSGYALILAWGLELFNQRNKYLLYVVLSLLVLMVTVNQKIIHKYDHLFCGRSPWDWEEYWYYIHNKSYSQLNNFDQVQLSDLTISTTESRSKPTCLALNDSVGTYSLFTFTKRDLPYLSRRTRVILYIKSPSPKLQYNLVVVKKNDSLLNQISMRGMAHYHLPENKWKRIQTTMYFRLPETDPNDTKYELVLENYNRNTFMVDDVTMTTR